MNEITQPVLILGAGGHARVVASTLYSQGRSVVGYLDDDVRRHGGQMLDAPVLGALDEVKDHAGEPALVAVGDNALRQRLAERFPALSWTTAVHRTAWHDPHAEIAEGSVLFARSVLQPGVRIGRHVIINTAATVDHDVTVDDCAQLCPGVIVAGAVTIGHGAFLGSGATIGPGVTIGARAVVGAGAVVLDDVPADAFVAGIPARRHARASARTSRQSRNP